MPGCGETSSGAGTGEGGSAWTRAAAPLPPHDCDRHILCTKEGLMVRRRPGSSSSRCPVVVRIYPRVLRLTGPL
eukprot:5592837-Pyramimonas_sp.AAC.1